MTLPLAGLVVVDIAGTIATAYCARLFADAGASVWNAEPAGGFATRSMPPLLDGESALHAWLSTGKQSVVVDRDDDTWHPLQTGANLVLHAGEPRLPIRDGCIGLDVSWFGSSGPYADYLGSDAACFALAGMVRMIGPVEGPPLLPSGYQTQIVAGAVAYIAALGHLVGAEQGRAVATRLELSILEATLCFTEVAPIAAFNNAFSTRMGINRYPPTYPLGIYHCHDGWLGVTALTPSQWKSFCRLIGMDDVADRPEYQSALGRLADAAVLEPRIRALLAERSAEDTFHEGQRRRIPLARVPTMAEMTNVDQFVSRKAFAQARLSNGRRVDVPVAPYRLRGTPLHGGGAVAALGAHEELPEAARAYTAGDDLPLAGIRIIDLSMGWAGPLAGRHLADLGADVVKVESCERFDWWRSWEATPAWIADQGAEKAVSHNMVNRNKRAITLDLEHPAGRELLLDLVRDAHAVLENYSAGVLPQLGLTYEVLRSVNPSVILLSMPAFGTTGPWAGFRAYGSTVEHSSGLPHLNGRPDDPPTMVHVAYGDPVGGINGAAALLTALRHQARTGEGQFVDLSQTEALLPLAIHGILHHAVHGEPWPRQGNHHPDMAPHGVYPCAGEDRWIVIQVDSEAAWRSLQAIAAPALDGFGSRDDRTRRRPELDSALANWTATRDNGELMQTLQQAGVCAARVSDATEVLFDPHFDARGFWQWRERAVVGLQPNPSAPWRPRTAGASQPFALRQVAPTLGQHNDDVLHGVLGLSAERLTELRTEGVIGQVPRMPGSRVRANPG